MCPALWNKEKNSYNNLFYFDIIVCIYIHTYIHIYIYIYIYIIFLFLHFLSTGLRCVNMLVGISLTGGIESQLEKK